MLYRSSSLKCLSTPVLRSAARWVAGGGLSLCVLLSGCGLSPLAKHASAFSTATTAVIDHSEDAYRTANELHVKEQLQHSIYSYDYAAENLMVDPRKEFPPLYTPEEMDARLKILEALKAYADSLVELTGTPSKQQSDALDEAASGVGQNLQGLSSTLKKNFSKVPAISGEEAAGFSTALKALGEYLQARKVKKSLPKVTAEMDGYVKSLCVLLQADVAVMRSQADSDYNNLLTDQNQFMLHYKLNPVERRDVVEKLIATMGRKRQADQFYAQLDSTVGKLYMTHHALAAAAGGNNPATFTQNLADLTAAGNGLASFYQTLAAQAQ